MKPAVQTDQKTAEISQKPIGLKHTVSIEAETPIISGHPISQLSTVPIITQPLITEQSKIDLPKIENPYAT